MRQYITPEQLSENTDVPHALIDFPHKVVRMPYNDNAGAFALATVPEGWDGKARVRVVFSTNGEGTTAAAAVSLNFIPSGLTNSATGVATASVSATEGTLVESPFVELNCAGCSGTSVLVRVGPDLTGSTADANIDIAAVVIDFGTW